MGSKDMLEVSNSKNQTMKCQPRCEQQTEIPTFTSALFPVAETFHESPFFCLTLAKLSKICNETDKAKIFEAGKDKFGIKCKDILNANNTLKLCSDGKPDVSKIQNNSSLNDYMINYATKNLAVLEIIIKDPFYTLIIRDELSTIISFLGNTGGLLGLCMGLSLVSIFEIFFHLINFILLNIKK